MTLEQVTLLVDVMTDAVAQSQPWLPCKRGCDWCCRNPFYGISDAEGERLREAVKKLDKHARRRVSERARDQLRYLWRKHGYGKDWPRLLSGEQTMDALCPLLENNECLVYADRPIICRCYGMSETPSIEARYGCHLTTQAVAEHGDANLIDLEQLYQGIANPYAKLNAPIAAWVAD